MFGAGRVVGHFDGDLVLEVSARGVANLETLPARPGEASMTYRHGELERYEDDRWTLWEVLADEVDRWHDVYADYWGLREPGREEWESEEEWATYKRIDELAPRLFEATLALRLDALKQGDELFPPLSPEAVAFARDLLRVYGESTMVRDRWSFSVAHDATRRLEGSPTRMAQLLNLVVAKRLNERTASYLSRVSRLYVYGFEVEALVMSRAALDTALQDVLPDERMEAIGFTRSGREYSLSSRIAAATREGMFSQGQKKTATVLRLSANDALHDAPGFLQEGINNALDAIEILADLLQALS